jgi:hypothetical protein
MLFMAAGKLRSADCVASGEVSVVVMNKKDFNDLDNPLLSWMLDYDAIACVLKVCAICWWVEQCHAVWRAIGFIAGLVLKDSTLYFVV